MKVVDQGFQKLDPEQNRQTDRRDWTYYHTAFAGGNENTDIYESQYTTMQFSVLLIYPNLNPNFNPNINPNSSQRNYTIK